MNIVTPIPTSIVFTTGNVNTELARRDNQLREVIPKTAGTENSAAETGLGSESDRVRTPGQQPQVTYERPQQQSNAQNNPSQGELFGQDNAEDPSAGKESAEERQKQQQETTENSQVEELKTRDREVRAHEQAHASVGGQYAGSPQFEFENGSDGGRYAVGGEVSIDISAENTPEETLRKMQQVRAAALAPVDPSAQDLQVAREASQKAAEAQIEIASDNTEEAREAVSASFEVQNQNPSNRIGEDPPELDEIIRGIDVEPPTRILAEAQQARQQLENRDSRILKQVSVIENFYQNVSQPREQSTLQSA